MWPRVRLKLPDSDDCEMGWRVDFRPMEVQLIDFANAAILIFLDLITQLLQDQGALDLQQPLGKVRETVDRAHGRNPIVEGRIRFPK